MNLGSLNMRRRRMMAGRAAAYRRAMVTPPPTAWWRFDDLNNPPGSNSYDAAVLGRADTVALWDATGANLKNPGTHTGTVNGNPVVVEGPLLGASNGGSALDFDGSGDYISVPYSAALNPAAFTVECWIYRDTDTGGDENIATSMNAAASQGYTFRIASAGDQLQMLCAGPALSNVTGVTPVVTGRWHHVAATYDGTTVRIYLNGVLDVSVADVIVTNTTGAFLIGTRYDAAGGFFPGKIAKPALHNAALTAEEIGSLFVKGRPVSDTQGSHAGGMIGAPTSAAGAISGDSNAAFDFNGTSDAVVIPYSAALNAATFSIAGWIKRDATGAGNLKIIDSRSGTNVGYYVEVVSEAATFGIGTGAGVTTAIGTTSLAAGTWYHIAATYDGTTARVYLNGVLEGSAAAALSANASGATAIGSRAPALGATHYFNGKIDELTYHGGRVLTDAEILARYNAGI